MDRRNFIKNITILGGSVVAGSIIGASVLKGSNINLRKDNMSRILVDKDKCTHCGLCIKDCLRDCIQFNNEKIPEFKDNGCISCQHCLAICPVGALSFDNKNPNNSDKINYGKSEDIEGLIKSRRSIRHFSNENIDSERLNKIKEILAYTPTGVNKNDLHFAFVETKEKMDEIRAITDKKIGKGNIIYRSATAMLVVSVNKEIAANTCYFVDPIIALSYIDLYAQSLGLGTLWCGLAYDALQKVPKAYSMLKIPNEYTLGYVMLLGIPAVKYSRTIQPEPFEISVIR